MPGGCHLKCPAWPSWTSADARLAKAMLYRGDVPRSRPGKLWISVFLGQNFTFFGCIFDTWSNFSLAGVISTIGPLFLFLDTSTCVSLSQHNGVVGGVLGSHMFGIKRVMEASIVLMMLARRASSISAIEVR